MYVRVLTVLAVTVACIPLANAGLAAATSASPGSPGEALSMPFQQTALCVALHGDDVSEWERAAVDGVLEYGALPQAYRWYISDPVKATYKPDGDPLAYFSAWVSMGARHPLTYASATLAQTYGYFALEGGAPSYPVSHYAGLSDDFVSSRWADWSYWLPQGWRDAVQSYSSALRAVPLVGYLVDVGAYTWTLLFLLVLAATRGRKGSWVALAPSAALLLTCLAGPVNGAMRYALGYVVCTPVCAVAVLALVALRAHGAEATPARAGAGPDEAAAGEGGPHGR